MARYLKKRKEHIGLSPDSFSLRGEKKTDDILLRVIDYNSEMLNEIVLNNISEVIKFKESNSTTWFNIDGLHDENILAEISKGFNLEPIILSDVLEVHGRPKVQEYDNCIFISLKMLQLNEKRNFITGENIVIIIMKNILITFQEQKGDVFNPLRERIRKNKKRIRISWTDYLSFAILDIIFDNYKYVISQIGEEIELLEEKLLNNPQPSVIEEINKYKKEIIYLNKSIKPCRELTMDLLKLESNLINKKTLIHYDELKDNVNHSIESLESYRELLTDQLNIYHTTMSSKLNDIMKFLTVFSVIFIPLTFIAGIYGTNFDFVPELHYKYSYFIMWIVMLIIAVSMIFYFKRKNWF